MYKITEHAVFRYLQRVEHITRYKMEHFRCSQKHMNDFKKFLDSAESRADMVPPDWMDYHHKSSAKTRYLEVTDDVCVVIKDNTAITVLTKQEEQRRAQNKSRNRKLEMI